MQDGGKDKQASLSIMQARSWKSCWLLSCLNVTKPEGKHTKYVDVF